MDPPAPVGEQQPSAEAPHASAATRADAVDQQATESMMAGGVKDSEGAEPGAQSTSNNGGEGEGVEAGGLSVGICTLESASVRIHAALHRRVRPTSG